MSNQTLFKSDKAAKNKNKDFVVVDANALLHRSYHALPPMTSPEGQVVGGVYGFFSTFFKMHQELQPDYVVVCFDLPEPTFRDKKFEDYKAQRPDTPEDLVSQIPILKELLSDFEVPILEQEGFEADDIIGTLAERYKDRENLEVIILTGDYDTLQLAQQGVKIYTMRKGMSDTVIYGPEEVEEKYGFEPKKLPDYKGLKGDSSDNIPGIKGVGEKTATKILSHFESLEELYQKLDREEIETQLSDQLSSRMITKLKEAKDKAIFSKELAVIRTDVPCDFQLKQAKWPTFDYKKVEGKFYGLGFRSLVERIPETTKKSELEVGPQKLQPADFFEAHQDERLFFAAEEKKIQVFTKERVTTLSFDQTSKFNQELEYLVEKQEALIGHDLKAFLRLLSKYGLEINTKVGFDTKIAAYLLEPSRSEYGLSELRGQFSQDQDVFKMKERLNQKLEKKNLKELFYQIELPLVKILFLMEKNGILVRKEVIEGLKTGIEKKLDNLKSNIYDTAGKEFNINSPQQLSEVLFEKLGLPTDDIKKTKEGHISTAASELKKLEDEHEIISFIFDYRELEKLRSTYLEPFLEQIEEDGRIHPRFNQTVTATGRLSSSEPNLQNIPLKGKQGRKFRDAFRAPKEKKLVAFDYSQIELRIAAILAEDDKLISAFRAGRDIHTLTASQVFDLDYEEVEKEVRNKAKSLNFGIIYGISPYGFAQRAGIEPQKAKEFIDRYFERFPDIKNYLEETKEKAKKQGYVETLKGRRRHLPEINSENKNVQARAERMAVNHPIQGTAADIMKEAMIDVVEFLKKKDLEDKIKLLLQVHDELIFEMRQGALRNYSSKLKGIMERDEFSVPLSVTAKKGETWAQMDSFLN